MLNPTRLCDRLGKIFGRHGGEETERPTSTGRGSDDERDIVAFVAKGTELKGTLTYTGTVRIDGRVEGEIQAQGLLLVGLEAVVAANVCAERVVSHGTLSGEIVARESVRLLTPSVLDGSVKARALSLEEGVVFNGSCQLAQGDAAVSSRASMAHAPQMNAGNL